MRKQQTPNKSDGIVELQLAHCLAALGASSTCWLAGLPHSVGSIGWQCLLALLSKLTIGRFERGKCKQKLELNHHSFLVARAETRPSFAGAELPVRPDCESLAPLFRRLQANCSLFFHPNGRSCIRRCIIVIVRARFMGMVSSLPVQQVNKCAGFGAPSDGLTFACQVADSAG